MSFDPSNLASMMRLQQAMTYSRKGLNPFREFRVDSLREFVGDRYSNDGAEHAVPVNLIEMATTIWMTQLVAASPKVLITTRKAAYKSQAIIYELGVNQAITEMDLEKSLREIVQDALFGMGIAKVGMSPIDIEYDGSYRHDSGRTYVDRVDLDDWVHDMSAKRIDQCAFMGNRYQMSFEAVQDSPLFDDKAKARIQPQLRSLINEDGDERPQSLSQGDGGSEDDYGDFVELWDIWVPETNQLLTFQDQTHTLPLRVVDWDGPEGGPYHILSFSDVPNSIMPLSPVSQWWPLHSLVNGLYRKMDDQAERQKKIGTYRSGQGEDAERFVNAQDGDMIRSDAAIEEANLGGVDPQTMAFAIHARDVHSRMAGNLDALGGLSPQADTLGQDELLAASAGKRAQYMQGRVVSFTRGIIQHLAWYEWTDPLRERDLELPIGGTDLSIPVRWTSEEREGDFLQYDFDIEPYSMQPQTPSQKLQTLMRLFQGVIVPLMPQLQQQGIQVNFKGLLKTIARYTNMDELDEILVMAGEGPPERQEERPSQSANTTRTNVRVNRPGATDSGKDAAMVQTLLGAGQPDATASITRPTG